MDPQKAVINPVKGKKAPELSGPTVLVSNIKDLAALRQRTGLDAAAATPLMMSRVFVGNGFSLAGPVMGSPYAVALAEALFAWGAESLLFLGWCGAIAPALAVGDPVLPTGAWIEEGTSPLYGADPRQPARPDPLLTQSVAEVLRWQQMAYHAGPIWTTDAIYRETVEKVRRYQALGTLGVEMELSALFSVAAFRNRPAAGLLVVSDILSHLVWQPGFKEPSFQTGREQAVQIIGELCRNPAIPQNRPKN